MNKKPRVMFVVVDEQTKWMLPLFEKSLRHWHSEEELPLVIYNKQDWHTFDKQINFYKATPLLAKELLKEYELVIKADVDQLVLGHLKHVFDAFDDYDCGVVYNINRVDPQKYGFVNIATIAPGEYVNCGLVALRSEEFVRHWLKLCEGEHFHRTRYKEQDLLNLLVYYGSYKVRFLDKWDPFHKYQAWNGLIAKGEGMRMVIKDKEIWLPKGKDDYPDHDVRIVLYHWAGGGIEPKMNYRIHFNEEVIDFIDEILK